MILLALCGLVGCSGGESARDEVLMEWELVDSPHVSGAYATPIELLLFPDESRVQAVLDATTLSVQECMAERGFMDFPWTSRLPPWDGKPYGVVDVETAEVWGFHIPNYVSTEQDDPDASPPIASSQPEDAIVAFSGRDEDLTLEVKASDGRVIGRYDPNGCLYLAESRYQPHKVEMIDLMNQLSELDWRAQEAIEQAGEFEAAYDGWNECVVGMGGVPAESVRRPEYPLEADVTEAEIRAAVIDATCMHESGFLREWTRLLAEEQVRLIEESPGAYLRYQELFEETFGGS